MDLFSSVTQYAPSAVWPNEEVVIDLVYGSGVTTAVASAEPNFYSSVPGRAYKTSTDTFNTLYRLETDGSWPQVSTPNPQLMTYPLDYGYKFKWTVAQDNERIDLVVLLGDGSASGATAFGSKIVPSIGSASTNFITLTSVLASPVFENYQSAPSLYAEDDYAELVYNTATFTTPPGATRISYSISDRKVFTTSTVYTASAPLSIVAISLPTDIIAKTLVINTTFTNGLDTDSATWKDVSGTGVLDGQTPSGTPAPYLSGSINYTTGDLLLEYAPGYVLNLGQTVDATYAKIVHGVAGITFASVASLINHSNPANNSFDTVYQITDAANITVSTTDALPAYFMDVSANVFVDSPYTLTSAPSANGYTVQHVPAGLATNPSANIAIIQVGYTPSYNPDLFIAHDVKHPTFHAVSFIGVVPEGVTTMLYSTVSAPQVYDTSEIGSDLTVGAWSLAISSVPGFPRTQGTMTAFVSSIDGTFETISIPWVINDANSSLYPFVTATTNDTWNGYVYSEVPLASSDTLVWTATPPENITFKSTYTGITFDAGSAVAVDVGRYVTIENLGVGRTQICVQSTELAVSGCTSWSPTSYSGVNAVLAPEISAFNNSPFVRTLPIAVYLNKNGFSYPVPGTSTITWYSIHEDDVTSNLTLSNGSGLNFGSGANATVARTVTASFTAPIVEADPAFHSIILSAKVDSLNYSLTTPVVLLSIDEFPSSIHNILSATVYVDGTPIVVSAQPRRDIFLPVGATYGVSAIDSSAIPASAAPLTAMWTLNGDAVTAVIVSITAVTPELSSFNLSNEYLAPTWASRHTFDLPVYIHTHDPLLVVDAIAYPGQVWNPTYTALDSTNYALSEGVSSYGNCHTETVTVSAAPGYNTYQYRFGSQVLLSNSNVEQFLITDNSSSYTYAVSAFDTPWLPAGTPLEYYDETGTLQTRSSFSSTSADTQLTSHFEFYEYPVPTVSISSSNVPAFILGDSAYATFDIDVYVELVNPMVLGQASASVVIETPTESFSLPATLTAGHNNLFIPFQTSNSRAAQFISTKQFTPITIAIDVDMSQTINAPPFDWCAVDHPVSSITLDVTAVPAPIVELFGVAGTVCTNVPVTFTNTLVQFADYNSYDEIMVDYGNTVIETVTATTETLTALYTLPGTYFVSVSALAASAVQTTEVFGPIVVTETCNAINAAYSQDIVRSITDQLILPHPCDKISVANEWGDHSTINRCIRHLSENIAYLQNSSRVYDPNLPFSYVGWYGSYPQAPTPQWHVNSDSRFLYDTSLASPLSSIDSAAWIDEYVAISHTDGTISLHKYDSDFTKLADTASDQNVPFTNAVRMQYYNGQLFVVDTKRHGLYVLDVAPLSVTPITVSLYFERVGTSIDAHALHNPTDIHVSNVGTVYVADNGNQCIKVYNTSLAWLATITHSDFGATNAPISVTTSNATILVLTSNGTVYVFDEATRTFTTKWTAASGSTYIRSNILQPGFVDIVSPTSIVKYTIDGLHVGTYSQPIATGITDIAYGSAYRTLIITSDKPFLVVDIVRVLSLRSTMSDRLAVPYDHIALSYDTKGAQGEVLDAFVYNNIGSGLLVNIQLLHHSLRSRVEQYSTQQSTVPKYQLVPISDSQTITFDASQVKVGINELVTADVVDRLFKTLCAYISDIRDMINVTLVADPCTLNINWTWQALAGTSVPHGVNCVRNPITWYELQSQNRTAFGKTWAQAITQEPGGDIPIPPAESCYILTDDAFYFLSDSDDMFTGDCSVEPGDDYLYLDDDELFLLDDEEPLELI